MKFILKCPARVLLAPLILFVMPLLSAQEIPLQPSSTPSPNLPQANPPAGGESVDSAELQSVQGPVEFISNTAAPQRVDSRQAILSIGTGLGNAVQGGAETAGSRGRYFVIHRLYPEEFDKLDADIFGLGRSAGVDTISLLRLIIQGYLQTAYGYSEADAALLAEYVTIYNAVHRGDRSFIESRYKTPLLSDLTPGSEGIALRYDQWPGQTLMLIPLMTGASGSLSAIDTTSITDASVIDKMREDPDKGVEQRQAMVDLKEREAENAKAEAEKLNTQNKTEEKSVAKEESRIAGEKETIAAKEAEVEKAKEEAKTPEEKAAAAEQEAALEKEKEALQKDEEALAERKENLEENKEKAAQSEALAERKTQEAQTEREAITSDQKAIISGSAPSEPPPPPAGVLAVRFSSPSSQRGTIVKVNLQTGGTVKTSALSDVYARTLTSVGGKTIAVASSGGSNRLIEIDADSLSSSKQGADELNENTLIWVSGGSIYAIISAEGKNYLALFDTELAKSAQSATAVHPWASVVFQGDRILTQDESGAVLSLKASDLSK